MPIFAAAQQTPGVRLEAALYCYNNSISSVWWFGCTETGSIFSIWLSRWRFCFLVLDHLVMVSMFNWIEILLLNGNTIILPNWTKISAYSLQTDHNEVSVKSSAYLEVGGLFQLTCIVSLTTVFCPECKASLSFVGRIQAVTCWRMTYHCKHSWSILRNWPCRRHHNPME